MAGTNEASFMGLSLYDEASPKLPPQELTQLPASFTPASNSHFGMFDLNLGTLRPSLWGSPRNYFNLPPLLAVPEWMPPEHDLFPGLPGPGLRFDFSDDFTLPTLGDAYQMWQSSQYYGFSGYSLWPTNTPSDDSPILSDSSSEDLSEVSTLPLTLENLSDLHNQVEDPIEEKVSSDDSYSDASSGSCGATKKIDKGVSVKTETVVAVPLVSQVQAPDPVLISVQEVPVQTQSAESVTVVEVSPEQVFTPVEPESDRMLVRSPQAETVSASHESVTTSATVFVLSELGFSGCTSYLVSGTAFLNSVLVGSETSHDIFPHEIFPVNLEANQMTFGESSVVLDEAQSGESKFFWQQGSHLSTVSFTEQPEPFDLQDRRREDSSGSTAFYENGALHFQFSGNLNPRVSEREVYLHSGVMFAQTGNRGFFGARREEALFLQQASRRLNTVSQNDGKDHGDGNPNSRAREIYQMALDEDPDGVKIPSESKDGIDWQPHPQVVVDTVLV